MKKTFKVSISLLLSFLLVASVFAAGGPVDRPEWAEITEDWLDYYETDDVTAGISFAPGSDETERYIAWYAPAETEEAYVLLATNADLEDAETIEASPTVTVQGDHSYAATLTGLNLGETYYYACVADDYQSETFSFTTLDGKDFSAIYVNDIHISRMRETEDSEKVINKQHGYTFDALIGAALDKNEDIALIFSGGDQASDGTREEYVGLTASAFMKEIPFAGTVGNHDRKDIAYKDFFHYPNLDTGARFQSHVSPNYWFVKGDVLFLMMDTNNSAIGTHDKFIAAAVKANPDVKWRIAVFHHELFGARIPKREQENDILRLIWTPLLDKYNIDMIFSGHSHHYSLSNVMEGKKTKTALNVAEGEPIFVKNPGGPIYFASGSINNPRTPSDDPGPNVAFKYDLHEEGLEPIFNIVDFTEDTLTINSYTLYSDKNFNTFTIEKDIPQSETPLGSLPFYYPILKLFGAIAMIGNNIGKYYDYSKGGNFGDNHSFSFSQAIFGK